MYLCRVLYSKSPSGKGKDSSPLRLPLTLYPLIPYLLPDDREGPYGTLGSVIGLKVFADVTPPIPFGHSYCAWRLILLLSHYPLVKMRTTVLGGYSWWTIYLLHLLLLDRS